MSVRLLGICKPVFCIERFLTELARSVIFLVQYHNYINTKIWFYLTFYFVLSEKHAKIQQDSVLSSTTFQLRHEISEKVSPPFPHQPNSSLFVHN